MCLYLLFHRLCLGRYQYNLILRRIVLVVVVNTHPLNIFNSVVVNDGIDVALLAHKITLLKVVHLAFSALRLRHTIKSHCQLRLKSIHGTQQFRLQHTATLPAIPNSVRLSTVYVTHLSIFFFLLPNNFSFEARIVIGVNTISITL